MEVRRTVRTGLPVALAVGGFGVSFGVLARAAGMGRLAPVVMSATTFAGSAQFAAVSILGVGGTVAAAVAAAVLLNARYVAIGVTVAPAFAGPWWRRALEGQLVVDESWALANRGGGRFDRTTLLVVGAMIYAAWVAGTVVGVFGGAAFGDPSRLGLDAAFPALFLALLVPQLKPRRARVAALAGAAVALALVPFTPAGVPIIAAAAVCLAGTRAR